MRLNCSSHSRYEIERIDSNNSDNASPNVFNVVLQSKFGETVWY